MREVDEERGVTESESDEARGDEDRGEEGRGDRRPDDQGSRISPVLKSSLLWGLVGGFAFLVLIQGYELLTHQAVTLGVKFGMALLVAVGATGLTYVAESRTAV